MSKGIEISQEGGDGSELYSSAGPMDIKKTELHFHNNDNQNKYSDYLRLVEEFEREVEEGGETIVGFIQKIQHYINNVDDKVIGLHEKLKRAGYEKQFTRVNYLKEGYAKLLTENELSKATQKIHAHILAKVWISFLTYVNPAIDSGYDKMQVASIMNEKVIKPVEETLSQNNVLNIYSDDIIGMIYFLTGNCHINWV